MTFRASALAFGHANSSRTAAAARAVPRAVRRVRARCSVFARATRLRERLQYVDMFAAEGGGSS
ncbi:hypothetical protein HMPREF1155_0598 [Slackia sp. CM382]|nr:hypothetical protein HMPREF1155_0598 [Slackia sp. CM382]